MNNDFVSEDYKSITEQSERNWENSERHKKLKNMWDQELFIGRKRRLKKESGVHIYRLRELGV